MSRQLFEYDPAAAYRFIPGLKARVQHESGGYLVRVNSTGFRCDHEFTTERTPGVRRILLFGDSFTAGDGVSSQERFGEVLERTIPATEVFNFGLPGSGTDQHYLIWQRYARDLEHDLVIIAVQVENIRRVAAKYRRYRDDSGREWLSAKPYFEVAEGRLVLHNHPPERKPLREDELDESEHALVDNGGPLALARELVRSVGLADLAQRLTRFQPLPEYSDPRNKAWQVLRHVVCEWVSAQDKPVILMPIPLYHYVEDLSDAKPYQLRFQELATASGATLLDPLPHLWSFPKEERRTFRFKNDVHPTPAGHRALAEALAPAVTEVLAAREVTA